MSSSLRLTEVNAAHSEQAARLRWVEVPGDGEPVLYLHGLGSSSLDTWAQTFSRLGRAAVVLDLMGHGLSERPHDFSYSLGDQADAIAGVLRSFGRPLDVISHSLGGSIAVLLADRHPELVRTCVLIEAGLDPRECTPDSLAGLDESTLTDAQWEAVLARESPERRATMRLADPIALIRSAASIDHAEAGEMSAILARTTIPSLLIAGQREYEQEHLFAASQVRFVRIPAAGHFVMHDQLEPLCTSIRTFWAAQP